LSASILLHSFTKNKEQLNISAITHLPSLSLSTSYLEPRFRAYNEELGLYPKMQTLDFLEFVYE